VTAYRWGEYLGYIDLVYDASGHVLEYHGAPIHLTNQTKQDPDLQAQIDAWREPFEEFANEVVGESAVELVQETCQAEECTLGNLMADAIIAYRPESDFALINAGGIRASIDVGPITRGEVLTSFPFGNAIVELTLSGQQVWEVLEGIVSDVNQANGRAVTSFLQVSSGLRILYDPAGQVGGRLLNVTVAGAPLDLAGSYQVATLDYLAGGGDNFFDSTTTGDYITLDLQADVLLAYLASENPVDIGLDGRISMVQPSTRRRRGLLKRVPHA
jgi:5'-nucleotidase